MSSDMLREASDSLFEFLAESFPHDRSYSRIDIEQDPMPPLLAHFLTHTLQQKLEVEVEHLRSVRSPWFDYDHSDVQSSYKTFIASLAQHSAIPPEEWRANLKRATKLVIAHLVLPTHTLVEYIFHEDDGPLPAPVIYRQLVYFAAYPYLKDAVEAFLKQRQLKEIDRNRFSSLLMQIDKHMTSSYTADDWIRLLKPMFDLMRRIPLTSKQGVPVDLLAMFFGDKEAYDIQERLYIEKELHRTTMINEISLRRVIEGSVEPFEQEIAPAEAAHATYEDVSEPEEAKQVEPTTPEQAEPAAGPVSQPVSAPSTPVISKGPQATPAQTPEPGLDSSRPLWEQFHQTPASPKRADSSNGATPSVPEPDKPSIPLWMQFQKKPEIPVPDQQPAPNPGNPTPKPQQAPRQHTAPQEAEQRNQNPAPVAKTLPSLYPSQQPDEPEQKQPQAVPDPSTMTLEQLEFSVLGLYGTSNRAMFIEHLFSGSNNDYKEMLGNLHTTDSWSAASSLIAENVFKKHNVNIYSPAAIMFTESVEEQYKLN